VDSSSTSVPDLLEAALVGDADAPPASLRAGRAPVAPTVAEPPASAPAPASRRSPSDAPPVSTARPNPMVFRPPERDDAGEKPRGLDPKILVAALGLTVVLAAIAFGAGLLWRRGGSETAAASSAPNAPAPRSSGLAGHAADELEARIVNVAALCDLGLDEGPSKSVFESAQRGCGTVEQERLRRKQRAALDAERPQHRMPDPPPEATEDEPTPVRTPKSSGGGPPANRCMTACQRSRSDCESSCGPEPKDASGYDKWQACSGRCLTDDARCRVACN
jgi:hypothetical protein